MAITFYALSGSPFVWRVWFALEHKALPYHLEMLSLTQKDTSKPEFTQLNPRQKVPLIIDDGFILSESNAIVEYLDECYPLAGHGALFPAEIKQRALVRKAISEVDCYLLPHVVGTIASQLFFKAEADWDNKAIFAAQDDICNELHHIEHHFHGDYLVGNLSAADYALYPLVAILHRMEMKKNDLKLTAALGPKIKSWMKRIESLPYYLNTIPPHWK